MKKRILLMLLACCLLAACKEDNEFVYLPEDNFLSISVVDGLDENDPTLTRAAYSGLHTTFENGDEIGVYAVKNGTTIADNIKFTLTDDKWVSADRIIYNPEYSYYAYFPYVESPYTPNWSGASLDDKFSLFIVDASNKFWKADQSTKDNFSASNLMVSQGIGNDEGSVNFSMQHKRTLAIIGNSSSVFSYSDDPETTYPVSMSFVDNIPYSVSDKNYFLIKPDEITSFGGLKVKGNSGKYIEWEGGEIFGSYSISYAVSTDEGATYGSFSSTKPDWLSVSEENTEGQPIKFIVDVDNTIKATSVLKNSSSMDPNKAPLVASCDAPVSNVDLSMVDCAGNPRASRSTANCYMVHSAGTYRFPLVYGNAIRNGATNASSYYTNVNKTYVLKNLVNHNDDEITDPWLKNNGVTVDGVELLWQDQPEMITEVGIDGDFITFTVTSDKSKIREGNAVISAKSGSTIVWSWHIWVTTETFSSSELTAINTGSLIYNVTPVNIGWVKPIVTNNTYAGARCKVKLNCNGASFQFEVIQPTVNVTEGFGHCTFYQWGRPIAEPGTNDSGDKGHPVYGISGTTTLEALKYPKESSSTVSIGTTIQTPTIQYNSPYSRMETYYNFWDMNQSVTDNITTHTVKTVYDPCPADFCVPSGNLYCYMGNCLSKPSVAYGSRLDSNWDNTNKTKTWTIGGASLVFPITGYRSGLSIIPLTRYDNINYWSSSKSSVKTTRNLARVLEVSSNGWKWVSTYLSDGLAVRAVKEVY